MNRQQHTIVVLVVVIALLAAAAYFAKNGLWQALQSGGSWPSICPPWAGSFGTAKCTPSSAAASTSSSNASGSKFTGSAATLNSADLAAINVMGYATWANAHDTAVAGGAPGYTYDPSTPPANK